MSPYLKDEIDGDPRALFLSYLGSHDDRVLDSSRWQFSRRQLGETVDAIRQQVTKGTSASGAIARVAVALPTSQAYLASAIAIWHSGAVGVTIGQEASATEVRRTLASVRPRLIVHRDDDLRFDAEGDVIGDIETGDGVLTFRCTAPSADDLPLADTDAWLAATSGSTGTPRFAVLTFGALRHNVRATAQLLGLGADDCVAVFTKPQFTYTLVQLAAALAAGSDLAIWSDGVGSGRSLWSYLEDVGASGLAANPTALAMLIRRADGASKAPLRYVMSAGQPLPHRLLGDLRSRFPRARVISAYGCTENTNRIAWADVDGTEATDRPVPVGQPVPGVHVEIGDQPPHLGEIRISGGSLMRGYLDHLTSPRDAIDHHWTGDLGYLDEAGHLVLTGRVKTVINVANEPVSPEEIEELTLKIDGVVECAVGALPDLLLGEAPYAVISTDSTVRDPSTLIRSIREEWNSKLSPAKRPLDVVSVPSNEIPRTPYGKLDRKRLPLVLEGLFGAATP